MAFELQPGARFGEYTLERRLGGGGFGDVWLSRDGYGDAVALKILHGQYQSTEVACLRAEIELLAAAASSRSEHIVRVLDGGSEPAPYIVMEYIEGTDLGREIQERGALPVSEVLHIAEGIADALATLQQAGIIHRDIKPANVMIDRDGVVKLTDFGIAKIVGVDSITTTNNIAMSVAYAAPEAFEGKVSYLSDHYAFGALLYHGLTGRTLFSGSYIEVMRHHALTEPGLELLPDEAPFSLCQLIEDCLAKPTSSRPQRASFLISRVATAQADFLSNLEPTVRRPRIREPRRIGPWMIDERSPDDSWSFICHHETNNSEALVRVLFSNDLEYGTRLKIKFGANTSRMILRPNERWSNQPKSQFLFWTAETGQAQETRVTPSLPTTRNSDAVRDRAAIPPSQRDRRPRRYSRQEFLITMARVGTIVAMAVVITVIAIAIFAKSSHGSSNSGPTANQAAPMEATDSASSNRIYTSYVLKMQSMLGIYGTSLDTITRVANQPIATNPGWATQLNGAASAMLNAGDDMRKTGVPLCVATSHRNLMAGVTNMDNGARSLLAGVADSSADELSKATDLINAGKPILVQASKEIQDTKC